MSCRVAFLGILEFAHELRCSREMLSQTADQPLAWVQSLSGSALLLGEVCGQHDGLRTIEDLSHRLAQISLSAVEPVVLGQSNRGGHAHAGRIPLPGAQQPCVKATSTQILLEIVEPDHCWTPLMRRRVDGRELPH